MIGGVNDEPRWEYSPNRELEISAARPTLSADGAWNHDAARMHLRSEVLAADARLFDAMNRQDADTMARVFSPRLEFFHDRNGVADHAQTMRQLRENFAGGLKIRRVLVPGSTEIFPVAGWGAMQFSAHDFCRIEGSRERCERLRIAHAWVKTPAGWQLLRVLSYDHWRRQCSVGQPRS